MANLFDDIIPDKKRSGNIFDDIIPDSSSSKSSAAGSFVRAAGRSAIPTLSGLAGAGATMAAGAPLIAASGPFAPVTAGALGLAGGFGVGNFGSAAQERIFQAVAPKARQRLNEQMAVDVKEHPIASFAGQLAPQALALRPSLRAPLSMKVLGAGMGSGIEAASEVSRGEKLNPAKVAISGTAGAFLNRPTALGRKLGLRAAPKVETPEQPQNPRVQKLISALTEAKPVRRQQESLYSKARSQQLARVLDVREKVGGEKGFFKELGQLKGELPKVQFEGIRQKVGQPDIDGLFNDVNDTSALGPWEKLTAKAGLSKLLQPSGGSVPTHGEIDALNQVFGPQLTETLLNKRPLLTKLASFGTELANVPRALMASLDMSAPLRQGAFLIGRPKQWLPAFGSMFKQFFSEKAYQASQQQISQRPNYPLMRQSKLAITEIGPTLANREEVFISRLVEGVPGVRHSNRAYVGFLNRLRADVFDDLVKKGQSLGVAENPDFLKSAASFVNAATGRGPLGSLERAAVPLSNIFFSPRLMASRIALLNPAYYVGLEPNIRKEAIKSLLTFAGTGATVLGLAKLNGAYVGTDPRSTDYGKIRIGNTRYDIWGGFQQYIVAATRLITGEAVDSTTGREYALGEGYKSPSRKDIAQRLLEGKTSPVVNFALTVLQGKTGGGEDVSVNKEIADRFIPMFVENVHEVIREQGIDKWWMAAPGAFGVGVQSYGKKIPLKTTTPTGKPTIKFRSPPTLGESVLNKFSGTEVSNIPKSIHPALEQARQAELRRKLDIDKAKRIVLETGRPQRVGNARVYLQNGIVKTKTMGRVNTPIREYEKLTR